LNPLRQPKLESGSATLSGSWTSWFRSAFLFITQKNREIWATPGKKGQNLGWSATSFILLQVVVGLPLLPYALLHWQPQSELRFACFFGVALAASVFKVRLPGIEATMSANFLFILVGILDL
jgi:hypothetical protein